MDIKQVVVFDEWLKRRSMDESWTTVAQHDVTERDGHKVDLFMTGVLAPPGSDEALLTDSQWLAGNDFGKTEVGMDGDWVEVQTEDYVGKNGNVRIEPFTFLRIWNDTWTSRFEIVQNFVLFYNLHFDAKGGKYVAVNDAGETTDVVRIRNGEHHEKIEIRTRFLRNYLACRDRVLVRQHDNRIHSDRTLTELGIEPFDERRLDGSDHAFSLGVFDGGLTGKGPAISRLLGKDLVRPHDKCQDLLGFPKGNCEFIVDVDDQGGNIMEPSVESGSKMFLTPVYFERDVLKKYYDSPNHEVTQYMVSCGAHWGVQIHQDGDRVMVFLGDIASLPPNEQPHWRDHNVPPKKAVRERDAEPASAGPPEAGHVDAKIPRCEDTCNEFKEMFCPKDGGKAKAREAKMKVAIAVAAFANAKGGRLFIGVNNDGKVVGLKRDLMQQKNSADELELAIRNFVDGELDGVVDMEFEFHGEDYLVIKVAKNRHCWVYVGGNFHVREGNRGPKKSAKYTVEYQKEHRAE